MPSHLLKCLVQLSSREIYIEVIPAISCSIDIGTIFNFSSQCPLMDRYATNFFLFVGKIDLPYSLSANFDYTPDAWDRLAKDRLGGPVAAPPPATSPPSKTSV